MIETRIAAKVANGENILVEICVGFMLWAIIKTMQVIEVHFIIAIH